MEQLINQLRDTIDSKQRDKLCIQIYDLRSGGRKAPKQVKIKEVLAWIKGDE